MKTTMTTQEIARAIADSWLQGWFPEGELAAARDELTAPIVAAIEAFEAEIARLKSERDALRAELDVCKYVEKHEALRAELASARTLIIGIKNQLRQYQESAK